MEFFTELFANMWQNLTQFEGGFIVLFLGVGSILYSLITMLVGAQWPTNA